MNQEQHNLIEVVEFCRVHNLPGEIVGRWVWLRFGPKPGPVYLRDLKPEYQSGLIKQIMEDPKLTAALAAEQDIIIGYYLDKPKVA